MTTFDEARNLFKSIGLATEIKINLYISRGMYIAFTKLNIRGGSVTFIVDFHGHSPPLEWYKKNRVIFSRDYHVMSMGQKQPIISCKSFYTSSISDIDATARGEIESFIDVAEKFDDQ